MKRMLTASLALAIAACSSHLPAPSRSIVTNNYQQTSDASASAASLTVETAEAVTLLQSAGPASAGGLYCIATFSQAEWQQNAQAAVQNGDGARIAQYSTLHLLPSEVKQDGDHLAPASPSQAYATAFTDDGHSGAICWFELSKLRIIASQLLITPVDT